MAVPLRIGLIGAGWIATDHVFVLRKLGHDVVATCDIDLERAEKLAPDGARAYRDWEKMLAGEELDAVWVATPPLLHRAPAVAAMERGLPVFLEKPIARTLDDARGSRRRRSGPGSSARSAISGTRPRRSSGSSRRSARSRSPTSGASARAPRQRDPGSSTARAAAATCSSAAATSSTCSGPWLVRSPPSRSPRCCPPRPERGGRAG